MRSISIPCPVVNNCMKGPRHDEGQCNETKDQHHRCHTNHPSHTTIFSLTQLVLWRAVFNMTKNQLRFRHTFHSQKTLNQLNCETPSNLKHGPMMVHKFYETGPCLRVFVSPIFVITHRLLGSQPGRLQLQDTVHHWDLEARDFHVVSLGNHHPKKWNSRFGAQLHTLNILKLLVQMDLRWALSLPVHLYPIVHGREGARRDPSSGEVLGDLDELLLSLQTRYNHLALGMQNYLKSKHWDQLPVSSISVPSKSDLIYMNMYICIIVYVFII